MLHSQKIMESLSFAYQTIDKEQIGQALKHVILASEYDESLGKIRDQLYDAEAILSDVGRDISDYMEEFSFDEERFRQVEERLDLLHNLQAKYGNTAGEILEQLDKRKSAWRSWKILT